MDPTKSQEEPGARSIPVHPRNPAHYPECPCRDDGETVPSIREQKSSEVCEDPQLSEEGPRSRCPTTVPAPERIPLISNLREWAMEVLDGCDEIRQDHQPFLRKPYSCYRSSSEPAPLCEQYHDLLQALHHCCQSTISYWDLPSNALFRTVPPGSCVIVPPIPSAESPPPPLPIPRRSSPPPLPLPA